MRCYDALLNAGKPYLGIDAVHVVYHMENLIVRDARGVAQVDMVHDVVFDRIISDGKGRLTIFDQEAFGSALDPMMDRNGWQVKGKSFEATQWLAQFMERLRSRPGGSSIRCGWYGLLFWPHVFKSEAQWKADIASLAFGKDEAGRILDTGIFDLTDVLVPTLYCWGDWRTHAAWCRKQCIAFADIFDKPLLPFLWGKMDSGDNALLPVAWADQVAAALKPLVDDWLIEALILWDNLIAWSNPYWVRKFIEAN